MRSPLGEKGLEPLGVARREGVAVRGEALDDDVELAPEVVRVVQEELGPHGRVKARDAREVPVAARREAPMVPRGGALDVGV